MKRVTSLLAAFLLAGCGESGIVSPAGDPAAPAEGSLAVVGPPAYRINGFGHQGSGNTIRTFSFSASIAQDESASGSFELFARTAGVRLKGEITCATAFGGSAWLGGTITNAGPLEGREAVFRTIDTGAGTKGEFEDLLSFLLLVGEGQAQAYCHAQPFVPDFFGAQGNITVVSPTQSSFTEVVANEIEVSVPIPCALGGVGETVELSGTLLSLFHFSEDQAGGWHVKYENNPQDISGYGLTSGDSYQGTGGTGGGEMFTISSVPWTSSFVNNFRIIGQGPGNNYTIHETFHVTVSANGELTALVDNFRADCS